MFFICTHIKSFFIYSAMLNSLKYITFTLYLVIFIILLLLPALVYAASDRRKITSPVINNIVYKVKSAVLSCPACDFEVKTTVVDYKRPCPVCGEWLQVVEIRD